ncbi:MAG TPA: biopolymer transporter ExbD [Gammaproteobacteria bacterium]|nr:biopolymer transporter ExbD [Gammaproteobacteria bacterium]
MKMSRRAKRMDRQHVRHRRGMALNLVSLMDIFTILVFFLLVNASDGEILPTHKSVELPESVSEQQPRVTVTIMVNEDNVLLHGQVIASVANIMKEQGNYSKVLQAALLAQAGDRLGTGHDPGERIEATIMGDREIPFRLLKKVMASCTKAGFNRISLAVLQKPLES